MADDRPDATMHRLVMALLDGDQAEAVGAALTLRTASRRRWGI